MARDSMGLTFADLEILRILVQEHPKSHSAAARLAGLNRARLSRLIQRVNGQIGENLDWRVRGRFTPPPEVRRLIAKYTEFALELSELGQAPRVSVGTCATLLLLRVFDELGRQPPRLDLVRSKDVLDALTHDEIDIALVHASSVGFEFGSGFRELVPGITALALADWSAVIVRRDPGDGSQPALCHARWEPGSTGERLTREACPSGLNVAAAGIAVPCQSFLHAIELVRGGFITEAIVPDIYLPSLISDLVIEPPEIPMRDQLIAIFRTQEQPRWMWLLEMSVWKRVIERLRSVWRLER